MIGKFSKIFFRILFFNLLLLIAISAVGFYIFQLPKFQTIAVDYATKVLSEKLKQKIKIGSVAIRWVDAVTLKNVQIEDDRGRKMILIDEIDLDINLKDLDYPKFKVINLDYILLKNPKFNIVIEKNGAMNIQNFITAINNLTKSSKPSKPNNNYPFTIDEAIISNGKLSFNDPRRPKNETETFDYYHFTLDDLNAQLKDFLVLGDTVKFNARNIRTIDRHSGLNIKSLQTQFMYSAKMMLLDKLYAVTDKSIIKDKIHFYYNSGADLGDFNRKVQIDADFKETKLHSSDIARFASTLKPYDDYYYVNSVMIGTVNNLKLSKADVRFGKNSKFVGDFYFKNLPAVLETDMDLTVQSAKLDTDDLRQYVGDSTYFKTVKKFGVVSFDGKFKGLYNNFSSEGNLRSGVGNVFGNWKMNWDQDVIQAKYDGQIRVENLDLGKISGDKNLQILNLSTTIAGQGFDLMKSNIRVNGEVPSFGYNGYTYSKIKLNGYLSDALFDGKMSVKDSNLTFNLDGKIDLSKDDNSFDFIGVIEKANLKKLGFVKQDLVVHSELDINLRGNTIDNIVGEAKLMNSYILLEGKPLLIDSLYSLSTLEKGKRRIEIKSEFLNAVFAGIFTPTIALNDLGKLANEYAMYFLNNQSIRDEYYSTKYNGYNNKYNVDYQILTKRSKPLFDFILPGLFISKNTNFEGNFSVSNNVQFSLFGQPDTLAYDNLKFFKNEIDLNSFKNDKIDSLGKITPKILTSLIFNSKNQLISEASPSEQFELSAEWDQGNTIGFYSKIKQKNSSNRARLLGDLVFQPDGIDIQFKGDSTKTFVYLLENKWRINPQNLITYSGDELCVSDLTLSDNIQSLALNGIFSKDPTKESSLSVQEFDLTTIKPFIKGFEFGGKVNGRVSLFDTFNKTLITTDTLTIDEILYKGKYVGSLSANANWDANIKQLKLNTQIVYQSNTVPILTVNGTYDPSSLDNSLNLSTNIRNLNLNLTEPFLKDIFYDFGGTASGALKISGSTSNPKFGGQITFNNGKLKVKTINTVLNFDKQKIVFDDKEQSLVFKDFEVKDDNQGVAYFNKGIYYGGNGEFLIGLKAKLLNYKIMQTTSSDIESFYGNGIATGDVEIEGSDVFVIKANLTSRKGTNIVIPLDGVSDITEKEDPLITFIDSRKKIVETPKKENIKLLGLRLDFNFNFTPEATCEIIIDSKTDEKLLVSGRSQDFKVVYDTRGEFSMKGKYVMNEGKYFFKFQGIANKDFTIANGSSIAWSGSPYDGIIDINTVYTQPISVTNIVPSITNVRYPVEVKIGLKDKLLKPKISFGLKFKEYPIQNRDEFLAFENSLLNDEQELNKNVSSVLIMQQLFPKDASSQFYGNLILNNLSEILSKKLGDLASKLDKNFEIGVSVQNLGQNVLDNMNLRLGYKFNDRFRLAGTFNNTKQLALTQQRETNIYYNGELEYLLTPEGDIRLKVYSKNMPPNYFGGNSLVLINGVILQYSKNFNYLWKPKNMRDNKTSMNDTDTNGESNNL